VDRGRNGADAKLREYSGNDKKFGKVMHSYGRTPGIFKRIIYTLPLAMM
jgi:hypothetical protein